MHQLVVQTQPPIQQAAAQIAVSTTVHTSGSTGLQAVSQPVTITDVNVSVAMTRHMFLIFLLSTEISFKVHFCMDEVY